KALCLFVFLAVFSSLAVCTYPLYAEPSIAQQRQDVIQRAQNDLIDIQTKLNEKVQEQAKAGDKAGARNTQHRLQAAKDLSAMLRADSQAGGDIFKVRLIESYAGILNADFSSMGVREAMNY